MKIDNIYNKDHGLYGLHGLRAFVYALSLVVLLSCSKRDDAEVPQPEPSKPTEQPGTTPPVDDAKGPTLDFSAGLAEDATQGGRKSRAVTRAVGDGEFDDDALKASGFGVYCWYTGNTNFDPAFPAPKTHISDFLGATGYMLMRNQKVEWKVWNGIAESWGYTPTKYWPVDPKEKLTLRAYAPYTDYLVDDVHGMPTLPVVVAATDYHNGTQHDPLWGTSKHGGTDDEGTKYGTLYNNYTYSNSGDHFTDPVGGDARNGFIDWYFHHGMSQLMFTCSITADPGCDYVTIKGISITPLYDKGLLSLGSATGSESEKPTWTECSGDMTVELEEGDPNTTAGDLAPIEVPVPNPQGLTPYPFKIITSESKDTDPIPLLSSGLLIIPRDLNSTGLTVSISYTVESDSEPLVATATIKRNFQGNTSYTLGLSLTPETKGLEIDIVQSAFTTWVNGGSGPNPVYNW